MVMVKDNPLGNANNAAGSALDFGACSEKAGRPINEDSCTLDLKFIPTKAHLGALVALADGMGGGSAGGAASSIAISTVVDQYFEAGTSNPLQSLQYAVHAANQAVYAYSVTTSKAGTVGTTLVAAALVGATALVVNVGDSRAYLVRGGQAIQITRDHNWAQQQAELGLLPLQVALNHERAALLTDVIGNGPSIQLPQSGQADSKYTFQFALEPGDALVLCSDGVSNVVPPESLAALATGAPARFAAEQIVAQAQACGTTDNASAVVVQYGAPIRRRSIVPLLPWLVGGGGAIVLIVVALSLAAFIGRTGFEQGKTPQSLPSTVSVTVAMGSPTTSPTASTAATDTTTAVSSSLTSATSTIAPTKPPTDTPVPPPPTFTPVPKPPTFTPVPKPPPIPTTPTATPETPTLTPQPTFTPVPPTLTPVPPTFTPVPPTLTLQPIYPSPAADPIQPPTATGRQKS